MRPASLVLPVLLGLALIGSDAIGQPDSNTTACPDNPDWTFGAGFMSETDLTCYQAPRVMLRCGNHLYNAERANGMSRNALNPLYSRSLPFFNWHRSVPLAFFVSCEPTQVRVSLNSWNPADGSIDVVPLETWDGSTYAWPRDLPAGDYSVEVSVVPQRDDSPGLRRIWDATFRFFIRLAPNNAPPGQVFQPPSLPGFPGAATCYAITLADWTRVDEEGRTRHVEPESSWLVPSRLRLELTGPTADRREWDWGRLAARPD